MAGEAGMSDIEGDLCEKRMCIVRRRQNRPPRGGLPGWSNDCRMAQYRANSPRQPLLTQIWPLRKPQLLPSTQAERDRVRTSCTSFLLHVFARQIFQCPRGHWRTSTSALRASAMRSSAFTSRQ